MSALIGVFMIGGKGAVATTLVAAGILSRFTQKGFVLPSEQNPAFSDLDLPHLSQFRFASWDICKQTYAEALLHHSVLTPQTIEAVIPHLDEVCSYPGVVIPQQASPIHTELDEQCRIQNANQSWRSTVEQLQNDILDFKQRHQLQHVIVLDLSSTAALPKPAHFHQDLTAFEQTIDQKAFSTMESFSSSILYAYAALKISCPCINFTPSISFDIPALLTLAEQQKVPVCGKDGKTGQTLYKTALAPMLQQRGLKIQGWYSTNILGNRDGEVLDHPQHRKTKVDSKKAVLSNILGYEDFDHQVHIHYYKPRGDNKEAWDNIDVEGWFETPMQMKINWLGSDSILAAPLAADLVRWMVYFQKQAHYGIVSQLSSYFKSPMECETHHFFDQVTALQDIVSYYESQSTTRSE